MSEAREKYLAVEAELARARFSSSVRLNEADEDRMMGEFDALWRALSAEDREWFRARAATRRAAV